MTHFHPNSKSNPAIFIAILSGLLLLNGRILRADSSSPFHLHQEGAGHWVVESTQFKPDQIRLIAGNTNQPGSWIVQRIPGRDESDKTPVPVAGKWVAESGVLIFRPKYPFREGMNFQVVERKDSGNSQIQWSFRIPKTGGMAPELLEIRPVSKEWPENLLRVYLHFNRPMARGESSKFIQIKDDTGRILIQPFLELDQELWDRDGKRLTLLFDPGRVKSGLKPREEDGAILEKGHQYTIHVAKGWPDARGVAMEKPLEQTFMVGPADHEPVEPRLWTIKPPQAKASSTLEIQFHQPVDTGMAMRLISVLESGECPLDGKAEISADGLIWKFTPVVKWSPGLHFIEVDPVLEDPSGNQVGRPFERDMKVDKESLMKSAKPVRLTFVVPASG